MFAEDSLDLIEFPKLLTQISALVNSDASKESLFGMGPLSSKADIEKRQRQIRDMLRLIEEGRPLRLGPFQDISPLLEKVMPEGAVLDPLELTAFTTLLSIASDVVSQLQGREDLEALRELTRDISGHPSILRTLVRSIDSDGNILDSASHLLSELRARRRRLESGIQRRLEEMVRDERVSVFLQDDFITTRSGRWVIPVRMDSKGQIPGVVHDVSKSGETAFVEPLAVINLSNELENLIADEKAEEIRILRSISAEIRAVVHEIDAEFGIIVVLDVLNAVAQFADLLDMDIPVVGEDDILRLTKARHPLLVRSFRERGSQADVVPLDVSLGGDRTVMIITGSNAGGKTIAIKTIGLLTAMALTGMPVPADSSSHFPLFENLLVDIGDEQSIESNLSTFAAHVENITEILERSDPKSLVLIDELGTGTDPDEGAALSCAVLKELRETKAFVFATTHLTDIKGFVQRTEGMVNASMEFDRRTLTPLYRLRTGEPGQSHALDVAGRYGLPERVIASARQMMGSMKVELDNLIADLNDKRLQCERTLVDLERERFDLENRKRELDHLLADAEAKKRETFAEAYREASSVIAEAKRQMGAFLEDLKRRDRQQIRESMRQAAAQQADLEEKALQFAGESEGSISIDEVMEGDLVYIKSLGCDASVIEVNLKTGRLRVMARNKEIEVPATDIRHRRGRRPDEKATDDISTGMPKPETVETRINLVGLRVDEALSVLEHFLNDASLASMREVTVIHGFGKGLLMRAVREHLKGHPLVSDFRAGNPDEGGNGVTVATLI